MDREIKAFLPRSLWDELNLLYRVDGRALSYMHLMYGDRAETPKEFAGLAAVYRNDKAMEASMQDVLRTGLGVLKDGDHIDPSDMRLTATEIVEMEKNFPHSAAVGNPIATCPKDGREFLAYDPVAKKFDVCVWVEPSRGALDGLTSTQFDGEYGPLDDGFMEERATLWWHLPDVNDESPKVTTTP